MPVDQSEIDRLSELISSALDVAMETARTSPATWDVAMATAWDLMGRRDALLGG